MYEDPDEYTIPIVYLIGRFKRFENLHDPKEKHPKDRRSSDPIHTPTTLSIRVSKKRPKVYCAIEKPGRKQVALKVARYSDRSLIENEWRALRRLNILAAISFGAIRVAPKIRQDLRLFQPGDSSTDGLWYVAYEWLDKENEWEQLSQIVVNTPIINLENACYYMKKLRDSLFFYTNVMHFLGIVHGDQKDEHIFVKKINGKYFFDQVRIIDFGTCYLSDRETWKGGSVGFSRPRYWNQSHRVQLSIQELQQMDWYGVYATLYYAYTGECFPSASPAYNNLSNESETLYLNELKSRLQNQWKGRLDIAAQDLLNEAIEKLCSPEDLKTIRFTEFVSSRFSDSYILSNNVLLSYFLLLFGRWFFFQNAIHDQIVLTSLSVLPFLFLLFENTLSLRERKFVYMPILAYIGYATISDAPAALPFLLPYFSLSFIGATWMWFANQRDKAEKIVIVSLFGPFALPTPLMLSIFPALQALLMPRESNFINRAALLGVNVVSVLLLWISILLNGSFSTLATSSMLSFVLIIFGLVFSQIIYGLHSRLDRLKKILIFVVLVINLLVSIFILGASTFDNALMNSFSLLLIVLKFIFD